MTTEQKNTELFNLGIETRDLLWNHFDSLPQELKSKLNDWRNLINKITPLSDHTKAKTNSLKLQKMIDELA